MNGPRFQLSFLHPRHWLTWLGFGIWYALSWLPYRVQCWLGAGLGRGYKYLAKRRTKIAEVNLALCFPEKTPEQRAKLLDGVMQSNGLAVFETAMAWFWPKWRLDRHFTVEGLEHLHAAKDEGVGVILMAFHFTNIDIGAKMLGRCFGIDGTYRPHKNPVYDYVQHHGRERHTQQGRAIPREDVRAMAKALRAGRAIWYAPDQDYGPKHSVFVPFFGIQAATITATAQLARMGRARVIPFTQARKADGSGYHLCVYPPLENFPIGDDYADAKAVNAVAEACIRAQPDQYLWVHRRFKTRPPGEPDLYQQYGISR